MTRRLVVLFSKRYAYIWIDLYNRIAFLDIFEASHWMSEVTFTDQKMPPHSDQVHTQPKSPQTNGMVERFNGRIEEVLQSHHFRSGEKLEATLHRYVRLYNQQLPQSALASRSPLQAMKDWYKIKPELFRKRLYYLPGCDK